MQAAQPLRQTVVVQAVKTDPRAGKYLDLRTGARGVRHPSPQSARDHGRQDLTAAPQTPPCVKGVINLRGRAIPVVDLRLKFGLNEIPYTQRTCIIVVQVTGDAGPTLMESSVDGVSEVLTWPAGTWRTTPDTGQGGHSLHSGNGQGQGRSESFWKSTGC